MKGTPVLAAVGANRWAPGKDPSLPSVPAGAALVDPNQNPVDNIVSVDSVSLHGPPNVAANIDRSAVAQTVADIALNMDLIELQEGWFVSTAGRTEGLVATLAARKRIPVCSAGIAIPEGSSE
jgi:hypothetical protein